MDPPFFKFHHGHMWDSMFQPTFLVTYKPFFGHENPHDMVLVKSRRGRQPGSASLPYQPELELLTSLKTHPNAQLFPMPSITCNNHSLFCNLCSTFSLSHDTSHSDRHDVWRLFSIEDKNLPWGQKMHLVQCLAKSKAWWLINNGICHLTATSLISPQQRLGLMFSSNLYL